MREIVSIYVGQAGLQMGSACWELFCLEHDIRPDGTLTNTNLQDAQKRCTFFDENSEGRQRPRALLIDTDPSVIAEIKASKYADLFSDNQMVSGIDDASNNWFRGASQLKTDFGENVVAHLQKTIESCSTLQGIFLFHSTGGGTGAGLGSSILQHLRAQLPKLPIFTLCAWPSPAISTTIVEPYNTTFTISSQLEAATLSVVLDNEALYDICCSSLGIVSPTYLNLNRLISQLISSWTASLRFPGTLNLDMNEMSTNLIPFPNLRFTLSSYAPILPRTLKANQVATLPAEDLTSSIFAKESMFAKCDPTAGANIGCSLMYRGNFTPKEINSGIKRIKERSDVKFVDWCPTGYKCGMNSRKPTVIEGDYLAPMDRSICAMMNTTAIKSIFVEVSKRFERMFNKRAYVHWYTCEGATEEDFFDSWKRLEDLTEEYQKVEGYSSDKNKRYKHLNETEIVPPEVPLFSF